MAVNLTAGQVAVALGIAAEGDVPPGPGPSGGPVTIADLAADVLARISPSTAGEGGKYLAVEADGSGLELVSAPSGTGGKPVGGWTIEDLASAVLARMAPALTGEGGKYLAIKADASQVEAVNAPTGVKPPGGWTVGDLAAAVLARMAPALSGNGGKFLAVNSEASAVELVSRPAGPVGGPAFELYFRKSLGAGAIAAVPGSLTVADGDLFGTLASSFHGSAYALEYQVDGGATWKQVLNVPADMTGDGSQFVVASVDVGVWTFRVKQTGTVGTVQGHVAFYGPLS